MPPALFYPGSFQDVERDPARGCIPGPYVVVVVVAAGVASTGAQSVRSARRSRAICTGGDASSVRSCGDPPLHPAQ